MSVFIGATTKPRGTEASSPPDHYQACWSCCSYKEESRCLERRMQWMGRAGGSKEDSTDDWIGKQRVGRRSSARGNKTACLCILSILPFTPTFLPLSLFATGREEPELRSPPSDGTNENSSLMLKDRNCARAQKTAFFLQQTQRSLGISSSGVDGLICLNVLSHCNYNELVQQLQC